MKREPSIDSSPALAFRKILA